MAIASNCGLFGLSHLGDYCASKFAIMGTIQSLFFCLYVELLLF